MNRILQLTMGIALALAACGPDDHLTVGDAGSDGGPAGSLTSYVLDLINNHTSETAPARPYSEFGTLPDPDGDANNTAAYGGLFQ